MGQQLSLDLRISYNNLMYKTLKGGFFSESAMCFSNLQNEYSKSLS